MIFNAIFAILAVVVVAYTFNAIDDIRTKNKSKISFKEAMDLVELPIATFYNKEKKLNFLLDTGSNVSYINRSLLPLLVYSETNKTSQVIGIEGNPTTVTVCSMDIIYKGLIFSEEFNVVDLDNTFETIKQESGVQLHGILGSKFFEKYQYVLDFKELIAYIR